MRSSQRSPVGHGPGDPGRCSRESRSWCAPPRHGGRPHCRAAAMSSRCWYSERHGHTSWLPSTTTTGIAACTAEDIRPASSGAYRCQVQSCSQKSPTCTTASQPSSEAVRSAASRIRRLLWMSPNSITLLTAASDSSASSSQARSGPNLNRLKNSYSLDVSGRCCTPHTLGTDTDMQAPARDYPGPAGR